MWDQGSLKVERASSLRNGTEQRLLEPVKWMQREGLMKSWCALRWFDDGQYWLVHLAVLGNVKLGAKQKRSGKLRRVHGATEIGHQHFHLPNDMFCRTCAHWPCRHVIAFLLILVLISAAHPKIQVQSQTIWLVA